MNKEICFEINSNELFLEQVLVEYNKTPIYFVCKDKNEVYYVVLCTDIDEEKYIVVETKIENVINLLKQKITMREIILIEKNYWEIVAGDSIDNDVCKQLNIEEINKDDLPYDNSYFKILLKEHHEYFTKLKNIVMSDDSEWEATDCINKRISELDVQSNYKCTKVNEYTEIHDVKLDISYSVKIKKLISSDTSTFIENSVQLSDVIDQLYQSKSTLLQNNTVIAA